MILLPLLAQESTTEFEMKDAGPQKSTLVTEWREGGTFEASPLVQDIKVWDPDLPYGIKRIMDNIMFVDLDGAILLVEGHDRRYLLEINRETGEMKLSEIKE